MPAHARLFLAHSSPDNSDTPAQRDGRSFSVELNLLCVIETGETERERDTNKQTGTWEKRNGDHQDEYSSACRECPNSWVVQGQGQGRPDRNCSRAPYLRGTWHHAALEILQRPFPHGQRRRHVAYTYRGRPRHTPSHPGFEPGAPCHSTPATDQQALIIVCFLLNPHSSPFLFSPIMLAPSLFPRLRSRLD